jgi:AcrR family transcriptional regulator
VTPAQTPAQPRHPAPGAGARDRILRAAYDLFTHHGVQAVGIERVITDAGISKTTLYRHFKSKDDLVLAVLDLRQELWTERWLIPEARRRGATPAEQLLAVFDAFDDWFRRADYEGCFFVNTLLESHHDPIAAASIAKLQDVRAFLETLAQAAGSPDPEVLASDWQLLMVGAIVTAARGQPDAAARARILGRARLDLEDLRAPGTQSRPAEERERRDGG